MRQRFLLTALLLSLPPATQALDQDEIIKLIGSKRYQEALTQINAQLSSRPKDAEPLFLQAITLTKLERTQEAIVSYKKLIDSYPNLPEPRNNLAALYALRGELQMAEQALQSAINTDPAYATAYGNLSDLYKTMASIAYNKALNLDGGKQPESSTEPRLRQLEELRSYRPATALAKGPVKAAAKDPAAKPAATPESSQPVALNEVEGAIATWAKAWSHQDVEGYLGSYSAAFIPPGNLSRDAWSEQRRDRIKAPGFIKVDIEQLEVQPLSSQIASVTFKQRYQSDRIAETARKLLLLRQEGQAWRIVQEVETR